MSINLKKFEDKRPVSGYGGALCYVDPSNSEDADLKYHILIPLESLPAVTGSTDSFEYDLLNSPSKGKVQGKGSLEDTDLEFLWHRDNVRRLEALQGRSIDFMIVFPDFTASKLTGTIKVRNNKISADVAKGTITITPITASETTILDCRKELKDTVAITSNIDDNVELKVAGNQVVAVATDPTDATITVTIDDTSVATVSAFADGKFTITGVKAGYAMVTIKASKSGMASWETTMAVEISA
jgi:hypothetical protein